MWLRWIRCIALGAVFALIGVGLTAVARAATPAEVSFLTVQDPTNTYFPTRLMSATTGGLARLEGTAATRLKVIAHDIDTGHYELAITAPTGKPLSIGSYNAPAVTITNAYCATSSSRFQILDITPDLARAWLFYEVHCTGTNDHIVSGELRYHEPGVDPALLIGPDRVAFQAFYAGAAAPDQRVLVRNTSTVPVSLTSALVTRGASDFVLRSNTCALVAAGDTCALNVGFTPSAEGFRVGAVTVTDTTAAGSHTIALTGYGLPGRTSWTMHSEPGDYIGGGQDWSYTPGAATISAAGAGPREIDLSLNSNGAYWQAQFAAPADHSLTPGSYPMAVRVISATGDQPGIDVFGQGRGCNTSTGSFIVQDAQFSSGGWQHFAATFEQHCEGGQPALTGSIIWDTTRTTAALIGGGSTSAAVTGLAQDVRDGGLAVHWSDPTSPDWTVSMVRVALGRTAPGPTAGAEIYHGRDGRTSLTGLVPGRDYGLSVFSRDAYGNVGPATSLIINGTVLTVKSAATSTLTAGQNRALSGRLSDGHTGKPLVGTVVIESRRHSATSWATTATIRTHSDGTFSTTTKPKYSTDYRARWAGAVGHLPGLTPATTIAVAPAITVTVDHNKVPVGKSVTFAVRVAPGVAAVPVELQTYAKGSWRTIARSKLSKQGTTAFKVTQKSRGTVSYRVYAAKTRDNVAGTSRTNKVKVG